MTKITSINLSFYHLSLIYFLHQKSDNTLKTNNKDIQERSDIFKLVTTFYPKVRAHEILGPIFNRAVNDWDEHHEKITDFWESQLLFTKRFRGNPPAAHVKVDKAENHSITNEHFGMWMNLWFETIDELFAGEIAERAKHNARKMSTFLYMHMWQARQS